MKRFSKVALALGALLVCCPRPVHHRLCIILAVPIQLGGRNTWQLQLARAFETGCGLRESQTVASAIPFVLGHRLVEKT